VDNCPVSFYDVLGLDNPGCDLPDKYKRDTDSSDCYLKCCAAHDKCYYDNKCTSKSWCGCAAQVVAGPIGGGIIGVLSKCTACNDDVAACMLSCWKRGKPSGPNTEHKYFCPNGQHKGSFYDNYDDIPPDCWECGKKPPKPSPK